MKRVPIEKHPGFWRRGGKVVFKYRDQRRRQRWGSARTLTEAKRLRAQLQTDVARGEHRPATSETFKAYARSWVVTYQGRTSQRITEGTRDDYQRRLERDAIPYFGELRLVDITPQELKAFAAYVAGRKRKRVRKGEPTHGLSNDGVRLALAPVKMLLATAHEEGVIRANPAAGVRLVVPRSREELDEEDEGQVKALGPEQIDALLAKLATKEAWAQWLLFFQVLLALGLRIGEIVELRWRDVDLGTRRVRVRRKFYRGDVGPPKTKFGRRTLKLTPELAQALWTMRKETRATDADLVFTAPAGGRVEQSNLMARVLKPAALAAGVGDWVGFHTFRHTCASELFGRNWNAKQVQKWLGHHKASYTIDTYVHLLDDDLPEPPDLTADRARGTSPGTQTPREDPKSPAAVAAESG